MYKIQQPVTTKKELTHATPLAVAGFVINLGYYFTVIRNLC